MKMVCAIEDNVIDRTKYKVVGERGSIVLWCMYCCEMTRAVEGSDGQSRSSCICYCHQSLAEMAPKQHQPLTYKRSMNGRQGHSTG